MTVTRVGEDPEPWSWEHVLRFGLTQLVAVIVLVVAWYASSRRGTLHDQVGPLNLAAGAVILSGGGNAILLLRARAALAVRRRRLLPSADQATSYETVAAGDDAPPAPPDQARDERLVTGATMTRYHRASCVLVQGKPVTPLGRSRRSPCGICRP